MLHRLSARPAAGRRSARSRLARALCAGLLVFSFLFGVRPAPAAAAPCAPGALCRRVYLPAISKAAACPLTSQASFDAIPYLSSPSHPPAALDPDINLGLRGYKSASALLQLVTLNGATDQTAPQMRGLFADHRTPSFTAAYQVRDWPCTAAGCTGLVTTWPVTLLGMRTGTGEPISIPSRPVAIYGSGYTVLVLYAEARRITVQYLREDTITAGYTVHIEDVCVDPNLLKLYHDLDAAGRPQLPALRNGQPLGTAAGSSISVAIRDTGSFMDPRSAKDWWQN